MFLESKMLLYASKPYLSFCPRIYLNFSLICILNMAVYVGFWKKKLTWRGIRLIVESKLWILFTWLFLGLVWSRGQSRRKLLTLFLLELVSVPTASSMLLVEQIWPVYDLLLELTCYYIGECVLYHTRPNLTEFLFYYYKWIVYKWTEIHAHELKVTAWILNPIG